MAFSVTPAAVGSCTGLVSRENRLSPQSPVLSPSSVTSSAFKGVLDKVCASLAGSTKSAERPYTVRQGDTLSQICQSSLRRQGRVPSSQDIAKAVMVVAQANNIADPNRIQVGQTLNLNPILSSTVPAGGPRLAQMSPSQELTRIVQSLVAKASVEKTAQTGGQGPWQRLVDAPVEVTSGYGFRKDPFGGGSEYHSGVDLAAAPGTAIHAWKPGIVKYSGWQPDYGRMVVVAHDDGTETAYAHNSTNLVKAGQQVDAHTRVALLGSTGRSTGPHLHFEVRRDGKPVDPEPLLQDGSLQIAKAL